MTDRELKARLLEEKLQRLACPFRSYFPDTGPLRRELYPRSMVFFAAGLLYRERLFLAANRTSKTVTAAYETTAHLTGEYPTWWPGRTFEGPIEAWAAGDTRIHRHRRDGHLLATAAGAGVTPNRKKSRRSAAVKRLKATELRNFIIALDK